MSELDSILEVSGGGILEKAGEGTRGSQPGGQRGRSVQPKFVLTAQHFESSRLG
ncbi:hypothetical protein [Amycolatopsis orientalis]|uniref:hypothetical protein n=1 Tax=Amycolatopsis orientalis TaxID=31958 RepID=UPI001F22BE67|nr:hypothetical protein [Amycolatopsis orientalis]